MGTPTRIPNHYDRAVARLITKLRTNPSHVGVQAAVAPQVQALEDALIALLSVPSIDGSAGRQLDRLGALLRCPRNGHADAAFRAYLRAQVLINRSSGTLADHLGILGAILRAYNENRIEAGVYADASLVLRLADAIGDAEPDMIAQALGSARAGGTRGVLLYSLRNDVETFACGSYVYSDGGGFDGSSGFGVPSDIPVAFPVAGQLVLTDTETGEVARFGYTHDGGSGPIVDGRWVYGTMFILDGTIPIGMNHVLIATVATPLQSFTSAPMTSAGGTGVPTVYSDSGGWGGAHNIECIPSTAEWAATGRVLVTDDEGTGADFLCGFTNDGSSILDLDRNVPDSWTGVLRFEQIATTAAGVLAGAKGF